VFAPNLEGVILTAALCVPGNPELVSAALVGLDSLLASPTGILQAFSSSNLYRVSPSISAYGRRTGNQTAFGPFTPISIPDLPRRGETSTGAIGLG